MCWVQIDESIPAECCGQKVKRDIATVVHNHND